MVLNIMGILLCFQAVSGLNINLNKSELVRLGEGRDWGSLASVLDCRTMELLIKYLGFPLCFSHKDERVYNVRGSIWRTGKLPEEISLLLIC